VVQETKVGLSLGWAFQLGFFRRGGLNRVSLGLVPSIFGLGLTVLVSLIITVWSTSQKPNKLEEEIL